MYEITFHAHNSCSDVTSAFFFSTFSYFIDVHSKQLQTSSLVIISSRCSSSLLEVFYFRSFISFSCGALIHPSICPSARPSVRPCSSSASHTLSVSLPCRSAVTTPPKHLPPPSTSKLTRTHASSSPPAPPQRALSLTLDAHRQDNFLGLLPWRLSGVESVMAPHPSARSRLSLQETVQSSK